MTKQTFDIRDEARQLLEEYIHKLLEEYIRQPDLFMIQEQARFGYYRSIFFDKRHIKSQDTGGKINLPRRGLANGFALNNCNNLGDKCLNKSSSLF